jgi:hypothetical protein
VIAANNLYRRRDDSVDKSFVDSLAGRVLHKAIPSDAICLYLLFDTFGMLLGALLPLDAIENCSASIEPLVLQ